MPHQLLNAKNHEKEAMIIAEAGKKGAVTVATNMAGRGVDIILGGATPVKSEADFTKRHKAWEKAHKDVQELGGLYVIGTERHESRRIDNQLRGRAGRQGDPGDSRFFVALEDDIMRLFGGDQVSRLMTLFKLPEDVPLEHGMVSKAIEQAQVKVEGFHFDSRKHLVEYDDVLNKQREIIYKRRKSILEGGNFKEKIVESLDEQIANILNIYAGDKQEFEYEKIITEFVSIVPFDEPSQKNLVSQLSQMHSREEIEEFLKTLISDLYNQREKQFGPEIMRQLERWVTLTTIDNLWMDHLDSVDNLREGIGLRGYAQRDPLVEYKNEAFNMFERLIVQIDYETTHRIFKAQIQTANMPNQPMTPTIQANPIRRLPKIGNDLLGSLVTGSSSKTTVPKPAQGKMNDLLSSLIKKDSKLVKAAQTQVEKRESLGSEPKAKLGRNDPCWCGSGKKFKKCHYPNLSG